MMKNMKGEHLAVLQSRGAAFCICGRGVAVICRKKMRENRRISTKTLVYFGFITYTFDKKIIKSIPRRYKLIHEPRSIQQNKVGHQPV